MHEFLLFGQVPASRHEQALNILSGVTASQPTAFAEQHQIFAPRKTEARVNPAKRLQQTSNQQLYFHDVYRVESAMDEIKVRISQEPEPGSPHVLSRSLTIEKVQDLAQYEDVTRFRVMERPQIHTGHHFVHGNVVIRVYTLLLPVTPGEKIPRMDFIDYKDDYALLDSSGTCIVEASIRLEDRSNSKLADSAVKELLDLKRLLQGAIELYAPDRLALDTRVKPGDLEET